MSTNKRIARAIGLLALALSPALYAITVTVAKSGADFTTISAAIKFSTPGDVIKIMDAETYDEQVTIDSTKYPLTLTSNNPASLVKPTIRYQDLTNVGPRTYAESKDVKTLTYDQNGALRIIKARNVIIDGIAIDGGGVYPFGYRNVWEEQYPLQFGNCAVTIWTSGDVIIRNCDIFNAYFGINFKDRNVGGVFAHPNPADIDTSLNVPISAYGLIGNHLIERNRIHNNSFGVFTESSWDLGSTIRYNLFYENHHPTQAMKTKVYNLTTEGTYQPGGAFMFKDIQLSPFAIYNNTFWHNFLIFCGNWQAGYQHLVFNNIFGPPNEYWSGGTPNYPTSFLELTPMFARRVYNSIFSAQIQAPLAASVKVMDSLPTLLGTGGVLPDPGTLISVPGTGPKAFPAVALNRWLEMDGTAFLSTNPASANFLEPNWSDENVRNFIRQQGWEESGVKNTDGTKADLGAIEQAHGMPSFVGTIKPIPFPIIANGSTAQIVFTLDERSGTMKDPVVTFFRFVKMKYSMGTFATDNAAMKIDASDMTALTLPAASPVKVGSNSYTISIPAVSDYAFIEMIIEATGGDGKKSGTAAGFLPYRKLDYKFGVEIRDKTGNGPVLSETQVGDTVTLRLIPQKISGDAFSDPLSAVTVTVQSGFELLVPGNPPGPLMYQNGLPGGPNNSSVMFSGRPAGGIEHISVVGVWKNPATNKAQPFLGGTSIKILSNPTPLRKPRPAFGDRTIPARHVTVTCFDLQGRMIFHRRFTDNVQAFMPDYFPKNLPDMASKVYLMKITGGAKPSQTGSFLKMVAR